MVQYSYKHILHVQVITRFRFTYIAHSQTKSEYAYTTGTPGEPLSTVNYSYGNSDRKDYTQHINVDRNTVRVFCLLFFCENYP